MGRHQVSWLTGLNMLKVVWLTLEVRLYAWLKLKCEEPATEFRTTTNPTQDSQAVKKTMGVWSSLGASWAMLLQKMCMQTCQLLAILVTNLCNKYVYITYSNHNTITMYLCVCLCEYAYVRINANRIHTHMHIYMHYICITFALHMYVFLTQFTFTYVCISI